MPHSANPLASLEDGDVVVASAMQHDRRTDTAEATSDDRN
jgi:hypothetical protein